MLSALLDKVGNLLEKEFLFASFLPALLFLSALATTFATVIGFQATFAWMSGLDPLEKAALPAAAAVIIVVFAYVLSGIQPLMVRFWSGQIALPPFRPIANLLRVRQRRHRHEWFQRSREVNPWREALDDFNDKADLGWDVSQASIPPDQLKTLRAQLRRLHPGMSVKEVETKTAAHFFPALARYSGESLSAAYQDIRDFLQEQHDTVQQGIGDALLRLDRSYGSLQVHPTRLGNLIEAYNEYSYKRYNIEPQVFWPHLQTVIGSPLKDMIRDTRTMVDFALTMASMGLTYAILAIVAGPWLDTNPLFWGLHALAGIVVGATAYSTAVATATEFGDLFRAAFDLYHLDLLAAFRRIVPGRLTAERDQWRELSELLLYAKAVDFDLAPKTGGSKAP